MATAAQEVAAKIQDQKSKVAETEKSLREKEREEKYNTERVIKDAELLIELEKRIEEAVAVQRERLEIRMEQGLYTVPAGKTLDEVLAEHRETCIGMVRTVRYKGGEAEQQAASNQHAKSLKDFNKMVERARKEISQYKTGQHLGSAAISASASASASASGPETPRTQLARLEAEVLKKRHETESKSEEKLAADNTEEDQVVETSEPSVKKPGSRQRRRNRNRHRNTNQ